MKHKFLVIGAFVLLISSTIGGIVTSKVLSDDKTVNDQMKSFSDVLDAIEVHYVEKIPPKKIVTGGINGLLRSLDPHSNFLDEEAYAALQEEQHGSFFGLGITIQSINGILTVISPIEGTPAFKAGLRAGDVISEIEGEATKGQPTNLLLRKLRGPKGTKVTITIEREGFEKPLHLTLTRDEIPVNSISYAFMIRPGVGYIRIKNFTETTGAELDDALQKLKDQNMQSLIVDLRFNTGGLLDQAIKVSDEFLEKGAVIVSTKGRIPESNTSYRSSEKNDFEDLPLIVLVNRSSASASEIVAGAIQDHDRGLVVGTTTWGKGLVQSLYRVGNSTALALTTARYYTPSGRLIQRDYSKSFQDYYYTDIGVDDDTQNHEKAYTETGREVFGGGGITPDVKVNIPETTKFMDLLTQEYAFFSFAKRFTATDERKMQSDDAAPTDSAKLILINHDFVVDEAVIRDFKDHIKKLKIQFTDKEFADNIAAIKEQILQDVTSTVWGTEEGYKIAINRDPQVLKALEVMPKSEALLKERKEKTAKMMNR